MAGTTMTLGAWRRRLGEAVELRRVPDILGLTPSEVGGMVKRKVLPVQSFRTPDGVVLRMVRRSDLDIVKASMRKPKLCDMIAALEVMAAQP